MILMTTSIDTPAARGSSVSSFRVMGAAVSSA